LPLHAQSLLSDQLADAQNPRGQCLSWVDFSGSTVVPRTARIGRGADDRAQFPLLTLGKSLAAFPADEEEIAPLEEFAHDEGERLQSLAADGTSGVIVEHEVAIGQQVR